MSVQFKTPKIVTDGLVFMIDSANPRSYTPGGTDVINMVNYTTTGSLVFDASSSSTANSFVFDGTDDAMNLDSLVPLISSDNTGTYEIWTKTSNVSQGGAPYLVSIGDASGQNRMGFYLHTAGKIDIGARAGTAEWFIRPDSPILVNDVWTHIAIGQTAISGSNPVLYVDGEVPPQSFLFAAQLSQSLWVNDISGVDVARLASLRFAGNPNDTNIYNGEIRQFRYYNRALTPDEIRQNYNAGKHIKQS